MKKQNPFMRSISAIIALALIAPAPQTAHAMAAVRAQVPVQTGSMGALGAAGIGAQSSSLSIGSGLSLPQTALSVAPSFNAAGHVPSAGLKAAEGPAAVEPSFAGAAKPEGVTIFALGREAVDRATLKERLEEAVEGPISEAAFERIAATWERFSPGFDGLNAPTGAADKASLRAKLEAHIGRKLSGVDFSKDLGTTQSELAALFDAARSRGMAGFNQDADASGAAAQGRGEAKAASESGLKAAEESTQSADNSQAVPAPESAKTETAAGEQAAGKTEEAPKFWTGAIITLIVGLGIAQVAQEFYGQSMPQLVKSTFGAFSVYASVMFFSLLGRTLGNALGGILPDRFGLKRTFLTGELGRLVTIGTLVGLMITGYATLPIYFALATLNGVFTGITLTAEHSIPRVILGANQRLLERFYGMYQWILEFAGIAAPIVAGMIIASTGTFAWTLGAYPVIIGAALLFFALMLNHPKLGKPAPGTTYDGGKTKEKKPAVWNNRYRNVLIMGTAAAAIALTAYTGILPFLAAGGLLSYLSLAVAAGMLTIAGLRARAAARVKKGKTPDFLDKMDAGLGTVVDNFAEGSAIAMKTPALRTAVLAESALIMLNGFLYAIISPAYGLFIMKTDTLAPSVQAFMVGVYSLGSMLGALMMLRANSKLDKAVEAGTLSKSQEDAAMRKSTLRWMILGSLSIVAFLPLMIPIAAPATFLFNITGLWWGIMPIYAGMLVLGLLSVVPTIKLKSLAARLTPSDSVPKVMGFIQLLSSLLIATSVFGMSSIIDFFSDSSGVPTQSAFIVLNGVLMAVMAAVLAARYFLKRQLAAVPLAEDEPKKEEAK